MTTQPPPSSPAPGAQPAPSGQPAIGYARISVASDGVSLEQQQQAIGTYCAQRGLRLLSIVVDEGVSGATPLERRPQGRELARQLRHPDARGVAVVVTRLDRAFRSVLDMLSWHAEWQKAGVALHVTTIGVEPSTPVGKLILTTLASVAEMERALIRERTAAAAAEHKRQGRPWGRAPLGRKIVGEGDARRVVPDPAGLAVLGRILELHGARFSLRELAARLEAEGLRGFGGSPRWHARTVARILEATAKEPGLAAEAAAALTERRRGA